MRTASIQAGRKRKSRATACFVMCVCLLTLVLINGCGGSDDPAGPSNENTVPALSTNAVGSITQTSAQSGGNVTSSGGESVTARGVCWSTGQSPTVSGSKTTDGSGTGSFTSTLSGLTAATTYYIRAYATNNVGTAYGNTLTFATASGPETGTVIDIDGNTYQTIKIGDQWWMAENLKVAHYRTGTGIVNAIDVTPYGRLYTRAAVLNTAGLAPAGWHVPSDAEWQTLVDYLGGDAVAGGKMKEAGTTHWVSPNTGATNEYGFGALPAGYWEGYDGTRHGVGYTAYFWSGGDTPVGNWYRSIGYNGTQVNRSETGSTALTASDALSIRCVKD